MCGHVLGRASWAPGSYRLVGSIGGIPQGVPQGDTLRGYGIRSVKVPKDECNIHLSITTLHPLRFLPTYARQSTNRPSPHPHEFHAQPQTRGAPRWGVPPHVVASSYDFNNRISREHDKIAPPPGAVLGPKAAASSISCGLVVA